MNTIRYCGIAVFSLVTASAFAQMTTSDSMAPAAPMPPSGAQPVMPTSAPMATPMNDTNMNASGSTGMATGRAGYDNSGRQGMSGGSGSNGTYSSGAARTGYGYNGGAIGSQINVNDIHATPQPGSINNQIYRGN